MKYEINSKQAYHETMVTIYELMNKGEANLSIADLKKLAAMSAAAEKYEDEVLGFQSKQVPETIVKAVELKMFENKMTQAKLASEIGIGQLNEPLSAF